MQGPREPSELPRAEYERRRAARAEQASRLARQVDRLANARLLLFLAAAAAVFWAGEWGGWRWAAVPAGLAAFAAAVAWHGRISRRQRHAQRAAAFYGRGLARIDDRWAGAGNAGQRYHADEHLYADDLDLFGAGSLFELICTARTRMGEDMLGEWFRQPAGIDEIQARQEAVSELREALDLREDLGALEGDGLDALDPQALATWAGRTAALRGAGWLVAAGGLTAMFVVAFGAWLVGAASLGPAGMVVAGQFIVLWRLRRPLDEVARVLEGMGAHLGRLVDVLGVLERQAFGCQRLASCGRKLRAGGRAASEQVRRLQRLISRYDSVRRNQFLSLFSVPLMLAIHLAWRMERWRRLVGPHCQAWLAAVGELEALIALSGYAYERPDAVMPRIEADGTVLDASELGHPLLPAAGCVRNDVRLEAAGGAMLLVSGSNMSGKSTLLRTIGANVVLALAGAPVRAARMRVSPLAIGTSINIPDSLRSGQSHFFAEVARLRDIVALLAGERAVLFLLDEVLQGTNSRDRRIGAEAVLRKLLDGGAIGVATTHDLSLAAIVDRLGPRSANAHFQDELVDGRMTFDYKLRPGLVTKSNALDVMRSLGLDV